MKKFLGSFILFVYLVTNELVGVAKANINWNGNNWALGCDFRGNDLYNVPSRAELCGPVCDAAVKCTHFTWKNWQGGTCWLKTGPISKSNAFVSNDPSTVCGVKATTNPLPGQNNSKKRGIAWPSENKEDNPNIFAGGKISWVYNWSPYRTNIAGAEFVPMLWSTNKGHDGNQFLNQAKDAKVVLGFNEPERYEQARMNPSEAALAWKQYIEPLRRQGARLGSPAIASTNEGLNWLRQFLQELEKVGGRIDFLALHWYGRGADYFINWITHVRGQLGNKYPVWVTEFACTSWNEHQPVSQQEVTEFMRQSVAKLDALSWVERYSWFGAQRRLDSKLGSANCLIESNGKLSDLGQKYVHGF